MLENQHQRPSLMLQCSASMFLCWMLLAHITSLYSAAYALRSAPISLTSLRIVVAQYDENYRSVGWKLCVYAHNTAHNTLSHVCIAQSAMCMYEANGKITYTNERQREREAEQLVCCWTRRKKHFFCYVACTWLNKIFSPYTFQFVSEYTTTLLFGRALSLSTRYIISSRHVVEKERRKKRVENYFVIISVFVFEIKNFEYPKIKGRVK